MNIDSFFSYIELRENSWEDIEYNHQLQPCRVLDTAFLLGGKHLTQLSFKEAISDVNVCKTSISAFQLHRSIIGLKLKKTPLLSICSSSLGGTVCRGESAPWRTLYWELASIITGLTLPRGYIKECDDRAQWRRPVQLNQSHLLTHLLTLLQNETVWTSGEIITEWQLVY